MSDFIKINKKMKNFTHGAAYKQPLAFDASTKRRFDDNGFMHVDGCHITKEQVAPYYGFEIPDFERFGLDPKKIYYGYRSAEELQKGLDTFNGLPLLLHHHAESAERPQKEHRVGSVGTSAVWNAPYIDNTLSVTDGAGIKAVQDGSCRQLSSAYQYDPDFTPGVFDGQPYDFVMRNIRGNHVALVEEGRAGPDVVVADSNINLKQKGKDTAMKRLRDIFRGAFDSDPDPENEDVITGDGNKSVKVQAIIEGLADTLPPEKLNELKLALNELADVSAAADGDSAGNPAGGAPAEPPAQPIAPEDSIKETVSPVGKPDEGKPDAGNPAGGEPGKPDPEPPAAEAESAVDAAWKGCGIDSDDPVAKAIFAKGFEAGQKGMAANDEDITEKQKLAQDAAVNRAVDLAVAQMQKQFEAAAEVSRVIGDIKPLAFDSVSGIYAHALRAMGVPDGAYSDASAKDVFRIAVKQHEIQTAKDAKVFASSEKFEGDLAGLNDIKY